MLRRHSSSRLALTVLFLLPGAVHAQPVCDNPPLLWSVSTEVGVNFPRQETCDFFSRLPEGEASVLMELPGVGSGLARCSASGRNVQGWAFIEAVNTPNQPSAVPLQLRSHFAVGGLLLVRHDIRSIRIDMEREFLAFVPQALHGYLTSSSSPLATSRCAVVLEVRESFASVESHTRELVIPEWEPGHPCFVRLPEYPGSLYYLCDAPFQTPFGVDCHAYPDASFSLHLDLNRDAPPQEQGSLLARFEATVSFPQSGPTSLTLVEVNDEDPNNPVLLYEIEGEFSSLEWFLADRHEHIERRGAGSFELPLSDLASLPRELHRFVLRGTAPDGTCVEDTVSLDLRPVSQPWGTDSWLLFVPIEGIGLNAAIRVRSNLNVYRWKWGIPGGEWNRYLGKPPGCAACSAARLLATSSLPENGSTLGATLTLEGSTHDRSHVYSRDRDQLLTGDRFQGSYSVDETAVWARAGQTEVTVSVSGSTDGVPWGFLPDVVVGTLSHTIR